MKISDSIRATKDDSAMAFGHDGKVNAGGRSAPPDLAVHQVFRDEVLVEFQSEARLVG